MNQQAVLQIEFRPASWSEEKQARCGARDDDGDREECDPAYEAVEVTFVPVVVVGQRVDCLSKIARDRKRHPQRGGQEHGSEGIRRHMLAH